MRLENGHTIGIFDLTTTTSTFDAIKETLLQLRAKMYKQAVVNNWTFVLRVQDQLDSVAGSSLWYVAKIYSLGMNIAILWAQKLTILAVVLYHGRWPRKAQKCFTAFCLWPAYTQVSMSYTQSKRQLFTFSLHTEPKSPVSRTE